MMIFTMALVCAATAAPDTGQGDRESMDHAPFEVSKLRCVIGNNAAKGPHAAWYNGIFEMASPDQAVTPFVPSFAGLNLEHYFDARPWAEDAAIIFEPRSAPMAFKRLSATAAELHQPETPFYGVESWTCFQLVEPYYLDMNFRCVAHKPLEGDFLCCFWASYMNAPINKSLHFLRAESTLEQPAWFQFCTLGHNRDSTVLPANDDGSITFQDGPRSLRDSFAPVRYGAPFYYGRIRNMVLIYVFDPGANIRFTHSPSGGGRTEAGDDTNPAWDFQFMVPNIELGREYGYRMRAVYKPWIDRADVLKEVASCLEALSEAAQD